MAERTERRRFDVEKIERLYKAGQLSNREIASQVGCSHTYVQKLARKHNWKRSLTHLVKKEIENKLVSRVSNAVSDVETIDAASDLGVAVIESHRKDIKRLRDLEAKLIKMVGDEPKKFYTTQYQGQIVQEELDMTATELAQATNNLSAVQERRIRLERQAYNLNTEDDSGEGMPVLSYDAVDKPADSGLGSDDETGS